MYNFLPYFFSNIDIGNLVGEIEMSDLKKYIINYIFKL